MADVGLSPTQLQQIFQCTRKDERRQRLCRFLNFTPLDEDEDLLKGIVLDFHYNNLEFAVEHGFPWPQILVVFQLMKELLEQTIGSSLQEAIKLYNDKLLKVAHSMNENHLKDLTDYVFASFFQHYKLFQFVFSNPRQDDITHLNLVIEPPPPCGAPTLGTGVEKSLWDYQKTLQNLKLKAETNKQIRQEYYEEERNRVLELSSEPLSTLLTTEEGSPLTADKLVEIVKKTTQVNIVTAGLDVQEALADMTENLESNYEQMMVEVPPGMQSGRSSSKGKPRSSKKKKN